MKKLLLVDDDAFLRDMYAIKFGEADFEVSIADTAQRALTQIADTPDLNVVLIDMVMPGMTGIELIKEVKETMPDFRALMIVLSNQGQESDMAAAEQAGAAGYIVKAEAIPSDVVKRVEELLAEHTT